MRTRKRMRERGREGSDGPRLECWKSKELVCNYYPHRVRIALRARELEQAIDKAVEAAGLPSLKPL